MAIVVGCPSTIVTLVAFTTRSLRSSTSSRYVPGATVCSVVVAGEARSWNVPSPMPRRKHELRSEEHTSELQSRGLISYAVFCLKNIHSIIILRSTYSTYALYILSLYCAVEYLCSVFYRYTAYYSTCTRYKYFFNNTATTEIYTLSLHDALPICL